MVRSGWAGACAVLAAWLACAVGVAADPQEDFEAGQQAELEGRYREAFDAYLRAWTDPMLRMESARRARSLERIARVSSDDDAAAVDRLRERVGPGFRTYRSRSYYVLSDADDEWTRSRITLLERAREQYFREFDRLSVPVHPHPHRLVCVFFGEHGDYLGFAREHDGFDAGWTAGYYSMAHNAIVIHDDRTSPSLYRVNRQLQGFQDRADLLVGRAEDAEAQGETEQAGLLRDAAADLEAHIASERARIETQVLRFGVAKVLHEAIHLLAFNTGLQRRGSEYPLWVSEGLASSFESHSIDGQFGFAFEYEPRELELMSLAAAGTVPELTDVVTLDDNTGLRIDTARPLYAVSYGLFKELHRTNREELAAYLMELADLPRGPQTAEQHLERFERHFGDASTLENRVNRRWAAAAREREQAEAVRSARR
ncbi:MAG: DUF1570 domain-containing protein [Phycisphaerales bacterium]|jgi:hypothetical protein